MAIQRKNVIQKRDEALIRTKKYKGLTLTERLELIRSRRGKSKKEEKKILNKMKENVANEDNHKNC